MYKKVTIVKEYYSKNPEEIDEMEPYTEETTEEWDAYKKGMKRAPLKGIKASNIFTTIPNENTEIGVKLRMSSREFFSRHADLVREYVISKTNNLGDADIIKTAIVDHAKNLNNVLFSWYRIENLNTFADAFSGMASNMLAVIDAKVAGTDIAPQMSQFTIAVSNFGKALVNISGFPQTTTWPEDGIKDIFVNYMNSLVRQIESRKAKDWEGDQSSAKFAHSTLVAGLPTGMAGFADVLSKGVILQSPWRFNL